MFALVDCNNFYASCQRVFEPHLIGKPVVILSNNDGCVIARSNEANLSKNELKRLEKLRTWEIECRDYNEVLKELANQEITFDLDDGVTVNYAKFEGAVAKI